jgi:DNA-binding NtrC family response regulator
MTAPSNRRRLLLVEDSDTQAAVYAAYLPEERFYVVRVATGEEALAELTARDYSLVMLDLQLPGIQGLEVLRRMKAAHLAVPVVVMTESGSVDMAVDAMHLGAVDFLAKPVDAGRLRLAVLGAALASAVPPSAGAAADLSAIRPLAVVEREAIESAVAACGGNIPRAAAALGVSPSTLYRKKQAWDDDVNGPKGNP